MDIYCQLLLYLDKRRYLYKMKTFSEDYLKNLTEKTVYRFPPIRFLLEFDVMDIIECSPGLAELLIKEPLKWQRVCDTILFICVQSVENEIKDHVKRTQVSVALRLNGVSSLIVHTNTQYYKGLVRFDGLLLSISAPTSYVYHSVWSCLEECEGNEIILQYIPKTPPKCYICKSVLYENSGLRQCGEQVTGTFVLIDRLLTKNLMIVDDLIVKLKLGSRYVIYAVVLKKLISVWGLEEVMPVAIPLTKPMPQEIQDFYKACKDSSWNIVYGLASTIGIDVCPLNCYIHHKITLLLSLVSVKAHAITGSPIIHMFAIDSDMQYVSELMQEAAKLADRFRVLSVINCRASTALIASSGGICIMPLSFHLYNQKIVSIILSSVEGGEVTVDKNSVKLDCAIWAQGTVGKKIVLDNISSVFGIVSRNFEEQSDDLDEFILQRATNPTGASEEAVQALKELKELIDLVAGIEVVLSDAAENLLKNYFLAARRERLSGASIGSMNALVAVSLNTARLCRRTLANTDDAVFAIWLHISGSPKPRFAPEEYLQTPDEAGKVNKMMLQFKEWLLQFTCTSNL